MGGASLKSLLIPLQSLITLILPLPVLTNSRGFRPPRLTERLLTKYIHHNAGDSVARTWQDRIPGAGRQWPESPARQPAVFKSRATVNSCSGCTLHRSRSYRSCHNLGKWHSLELCIMQTPQAHAAVLTDRQHHREQWRSEPPPEVNESLSSRFQIESEGKARQPGMGGPNNGERFKRPSGLGPSRRDVFLLPLG